MTGRLRSVRIAAPIVLTLLAASVAVAGSDAAADDFYETFEDEQLSVPVIEGVLRNDTTDRGPCVVSTDVTGLQGHLPLDSTGFDGQFQFSPNADFNGATSFTYLLGKVDTTCVSTGLTATVTITVFERNDPPTIALAEACEDDITVAEDSGEYDDPGHCVEMLTFGPVDENNESFDAWVVSSNNPGLFATKPAISQVDGLFGRLSFTPAADANGSATVTVRGRDSGGTTDGGVDLSERVRFTITVTAVDDPTPVPTEAPATDEPTPEATPDATAGAPSPSAGVEPGASAAVTLAPSGGPGTTPESTPVPGPAADAGGLPPLPLLLGILLFVLLAGFGAAILVPRWRAGRSG